MTTIDFGAAWSASLRRGPEAELRGWIDAALAWCVQTDAIAMKHFRRDLGIRQKPDKSFLTVADTAQGIEPEQLQRIFEPFVQVESVYTRRHEGTGLGLAISLRLARSMGGELTVESEPGQGSRFTLWLPAAEDQGTGDRLQGTAGTS